MAQADIQFEEKGKNDWTVLAVKGRIDTITAEEAEQKGKDVLAAVQKLAIDFSELEYISSAGLRVLLRLAKKAKAENKEYVIVGAKGLVKEVMAISGMNMLFKILNSCDDLN